MPQSPRRPYRIVLDTNIVMDLLHFADPRTAVLAAGLDSGRLQCFTDGECLAELARVAGYPGFGLDAAARNDLLERYRRLARQCDERKESEDYQAEDAGEPGNSSGNATAPLPQCRDPDDQKFLALAVRCRADLLLTRDNELLRLAPPLPGRHPEPDPARPRLPFRILSAAAASALFSGLDAAPEDPAPRV